MRTVSFTHWRGVVLGVTATTLLLTGCASAPAPSPPTTTTATPSPSPLMEESLDIAVDLYQKLVEAEGDVIASGGKDTEAVEVLITENMQGYLDGLVELAESDSFTLEGSMTVLRDKSFVWRFTGDTVTIFACLDAEDSQMFDSSGNPRGGNRQGVIQPVEVRVTGLNSTPQIDEVMQWKDQELCR